MGKQLRGTLIFILLALLALPVRADDVGHPVTMWKVTGGSNSIYLLGSIHLLRSQDYPLPTAIDAAYDDADVLIMEVDMDDMDPFSAQAAFTRYGVLHDDTTLRDLMGDSQYSEAMAAAERIDIPLEMLNKTEPWYAAMTVEIMMLSRIGFNPELGIEMHMMSKASHDGKVIEGFETVEEQILFLDSMSLQAQREMLLSTLAQGAKLAEMMDGLIDAWHHGDIAQLEAGMLAELAEHEELSKVLVTDRNLRWVRQIEDLLDDNDDYLIIVGALHLVGPNGVPNQLKNLGFNVLQLSNPPPLQ